MKKELFDNNPILKLSFDFALMVIEYCETLDVEKKYIISRQLLKSGTSIGANAMEAQNGESKADFIHKMKIALKELRETRINLRIILEKPICTQEPILSAFKEVNELIAIFTVSIATAKRNTASKT